MKKSFWMLLLASAVIIMLGACGAREEAGTKAMEKTLEQAGGGDVDIDKRGDKVTIEQNGHKSEISLGAKEWPKDMPSEIPVFSYRAVTNVTRTSSPEGDGWTVFFESATEAEMSKYEIALKKAGFETMSIKMGAGGTVGGEKGNLVVSCMYSEKQALVGVQRRKE